MRLDVASRHILLLGAIPASQTQVGNMSFQSGRCVGEQLQQLVKSMRIENSRHHLDSWSMLEGM